VPKHQALQALKTKVQDPKIADMYVAALKDPFWRTRSDALTSLEKYKGNNEGIRRQIQELAVKDKISTVRADAINILATM
jgi:hypothetical protein